MITDGTKKQLHRVTLVFWILLLYIVAAVVWWFFSLEKQNYQIYEAKKREVISQKLPSYQQQIALIDQQKRRNRAKHISEGATFLLLIVFGAIYIYRLVRRQFQWQQQQQNFVMAVTHELKTPIAVAKLNLETLQKHQLDEEKQRKLIQITLQETMRLDTLINNILIVSQLDVAHYKTLKEEVAFSNLIAATVEQFRNRYPEKKVIANIEPSIKLIGDPLLLKLLVSNLLENAYKYAPKATAITCQLYTDAATIQLQVIDEGFGIRNEEKQKVFTKFYRIGSEQTRKTKGTGLGLYICKKIVESHHATITIIDHVPKGSNFIVIFNA